MQTRQVRPITTLSHFRKHKGADRSIANSSGQYCDPLLMEWSTLGPFNSSQSCSECWLGAQAHQIDSPFEYDAGFASNFASLTSSCNATQYSYTTPTAYALNTSTTATAASTVITSTPPACTGTYTVQDGDSCVSISTALNVSTFDLAYYNNINIYCQDFQSNIGTTLCVPPTCQTHSWQALDTCASVALAYPPITIPQLLAWNPNFNSLCGNAVQFTG